eukprot:COSAG04_NODE_15680_length_523_cov_2.922170_1_plen_21_part_01
MHCSRDQLDIGLSAATAAVNS